MIFNRRKHEEGQSVVEAALVLPLLILLICAILDFGWIFAHQIMINSTSRDAARFAAINYSDSDLQQLVASKFSLNDGMGGGDDLEFIVTRTESGDVRVRVVKNLRVLTPLAGIFTSDQLVELDSVSVMWAG